MVTQVSGYIQSFKPLRWLTAFHFVPRFTCQKCFKWDIMQLLFPPHWVLPLCVEFALQEWQFKVWDCSSSINLDRSRARISFADHCHPSSTPDTIPLHFPATAWEAIYVKGPCICVNVSPCPYIYTNENKSGEKHRIYSRFLVKWNSLNLSNFLIPKRNKQSGQVFRLNGLQLFK